MYIDNSYLAAVTIRRPIIAEFTSGQIANYTTDVLHLLMSDPEVVCITAEDTGEIIYYVD